MKRYFEKRRICAGFEGKTRNCLIVCKTETLKNLINCYQILDFGSIMKKLFFVVFIILAFCFNLFAQSFEEWIPLNQLVKESDLIVSGTLISVSRHTDNNIDYSEGILVIEEFISGNVKTTENFALKSGDRIKLTWQNPSTKVNGRVEFGGSENNETIKILKVKSDGTVTADNLFSMRAASTGQRREIKEILQKENTRKDLRKVKLFNETYPINTNPNQQAQNPDTNQNHVVEVRSKSSDYSSLAVLITILFSLSLYWVLYRSQFKIR